MAAYPLSSSAPSHLSWGPYTKPNYPVPKHQQVGFMPPQPLPFQPSPIGDTHSCSPDIAAWSSSLVEGHHTRSSTPNSLLLDPQTGQVSYQSSSLQRTGKTLSAAQRLRSCVGRGPSSPDGSSRRGSVGGKGYHPYASALPTMADGFGGWSGFHPAGKVSPAPQSKKSAGYVESVEPSVFAGGPLQGNALSSSVPDDSILLSRTGGKMGPIRRQSVPASQLTPHQFLSRSSLPTPPVSSSASSRYLVPLSSESEETDSSSSGLPLAFESPSYPSGNLPPDLAYRRSSVCPSLSSVTTSLPSESPYSHSDLPLYQPDAPASNHFLWESTNSEGPKATVPSHFAPYSQHTGFYPPSAYSSSTPSYPAVSSHPLDHTFHQPSIYIPPVPLTATLVHNPSPPIGSGYFHHSLLLGPSSGANEEETHKRAYSEAYHLLHPHDLRTNLSAYEDEEIEITSGIWGQ